MGLYCFDCRNWRNKFAMTISHMGKVVGRVCIKCAKKREVQGRPAGMGWKTAFRQFAFNLMKQKEAAKQAAKIQPVSPLSKRAKLPDKKQGDG